MTQLRPGADDGDRETRKTEIAANLAEVRARIEAACMAAGRAVGEVSLVAVTKTFPASDVVLLSELGITDVGENRDQDAAPKAAQTAASGISLTWHFIGQLQVNKAASVASYADVVQSVDRPRLVTALGRRAVAADRRLRCLIQVSLDDAASAPAGAGGLAAETGGPAGRGGAAAADVLALADQIAAEPGLSLGGVMAVAPLGQPAGTSFSKLRDIAGLVRSEHPDAVAISAGMSGDLEEAIKYGATLVRIGTALLGGRRAFVR